MAIPAFIVIPDARLLPDAPVRSVDGLALRDNLYAALQADEADDPPQMHTDGIADAAVTYEKMGAWYSTYNAIGSYLFAGSTNNTAVGPGSTKAGAGLRPAGVLSTQTFNQNFPPVYNTGGVYYHAGITTFTPSGTWQCMGVDQSGAAPARCGATLWIRIA